MNLDRYKDFLRELGVDTEPPAAILGLPEVSDEQVDVFRECLKGDPTAGRLRRTILPLCDQRNLAKFITMFVSRSVEEQFVPDRTQRGKKVLAHLRRQIRENKKKRLPTADLQQSLERARRAFDTRWMGAANRSAEIPASFWMFTVAEYVRFRAELSLRPLDWTALLAAASAAAGWRRPVRVDGTLLARNLNDLARRHPDAIPTGPKAAEIIEAHRLRGY